MLHYHIQNALCKDSLSRPQNIVSTATRDLKIHFPCSKTYLSCICDWPI